MAARARATLDSSFEKNAEVYIAMVKRCKHILLALVFPM